MTDQAVICCLMYHWLKVWINHVREAYDCTTDSDIFSNKSLWVRIFKKKKKKKTSKVFEILEHRPQYCVKNVLCKCCGLLRFQISIKR